MAGDAAAKSATDVMRLINDSHGHKEYSHFTRSYP